MKDYYLHNICILIILLLIILLINKYEKYEGFVNTSNSQVIPKVIFQTSREPIEDYVVLMIKEKSPGWKYKYFSDENIIAYFKENPLEEFADIIDQFNRLKGAHRADLFRYYYLYLEGGVFIDSDAMIEVNMHRIIQDYQFVSINSLCNPNTIFQGLIAAVPKNEIIYKALQDAYVVKREDLDSDYHLLIKHLYNIVNEKTYDFKIKLYSEYMCGIYDDIGCSYDGDESSELILQHYYLSKKVPR